VRTDTRCILCVNFVRFVVQNQRYNINCDAQVLRVSKLHNAELCEIQAMIITSCIKGEAGGHRVFLHYA
jgi:hypothetical protein